MILTIIVLILSGFMAWYGVSVWAAQQRVIRRLKLQERPKVQITLDARRFNKDMARVRRQILGNIIRAKGFRGEALTTRCGSARRRGVHSPLSPLIPKIVRRV